MTHDALVIGGGPAGATAALLLARAGWAVALAERSGFPRRKVCGEFISATSFGVLRALGVEDEFARDAGPEIRRVAIFAGRHSVAASMPSPRDAEPRWGRALGREHLDTLLLQRATAAGAEVLQPCTVISVEQRDADVRCVLASGGTGTELRARIVIAAQGSWGRGELPGQDPGERARPSDLFGFKAHFRGGTLPPDLMPLLAFPDGYGGMVRTDGGRLSLSCCIRRDRLAACRARFPGTGAAQSVLAHIMEHCRGAADAMSGAELLGSWLAVGPIRPGFRPLYRRRVFLAGNVAAEAHPVIAEGISLAIQGASLLARCLIAHRGPIRGGAPHAAGREYAALWRRQFAARVRRSALVAQLAMHPAISTTAMPLFARFPGLLTQCTRLCDKARPPVEFGGMEPDAAG